MYIIVLWKKMALTLSFNLVRGSIEEFQVQLDDI